jgi:Subtilase family
MATLPILIFPTYVTAARAKKGGGETQVHLPTAARQGARIGPQIQRLERAFADGTGALRTDVEGAEPEKVIVLETVGSISDFFNAVRRIGGLEWLAEVDEEMAADQDFYRPDKREAAVSGRLFLVMANRAALDELLRLWTAYQTNPEQKFEWGFGKWRELFRRLRTLRLWSAEDRLRDTGLLENWRFDIENGRQTVSFEAELWFRGSDETRRRAALEVSQAVTEAGGQVAQTATHSEIGYHALLGSLPAAAATRILQNEAIRLLQLDQIMFFRPAGQSISSPPDTPPVEFAGAVGAEPLPVGTPRVGLLDGLPLSNHALLAGRLMIDDPQGWEQDYQAGERLHGTAMASLIVRGDLSSVEDAITRPLYVRPIMRPDSRDFRVPRAEGIPANQLAVDLLHGAVKRLYEGEGQTAAVAPTVRVLNLSIGDPTRPLDGPMSPFARMVDWLSWKYGVLFLVSAGNDGSNLELDILRTAMPQLAGADLSSAVARSIHANAHLRRILSPSEAINAVTVGSLHGDDSGVTVPATLIDPYPGMGYPSPLNRIGLGFKRGVKPDVLLEGGLQLYRMSPNPAEVNGVLVLASTPRTGPGQLVASPGQGAELRASRFVCGTSNATALGTRSCDLILEMLDSMDAEWSDAQLAVLAKALLVHGATWTEAVAAIRQSLQLGTDYRDHVARYLGYGAVRLERVLGCEDHRVTVISASEIGNDEGHLYELPLPPSLSGVVGIRRLIISLAWLTPINPLHRDYRRAGLWVSTPESDLNVNRSSADWQTVQRGTMQHEIFEGEAAVAYVDGATIRLKVNCRADAGRLDERIPYALVVTLEAGENLRIPVYQEVAERINLRTEVRAV